MTSFSRTRDGPQEGGSTVPHPSRDWTQLSLHPPCPGALPLVNSSSSPAGAPPTMGSGHPVPFRVLSGASARRPLCPRGSQLPRHPDQHHCGRTAVSVSPPPPDPRRSAPARSCVCLGHTPAPEQRQRMEERRTGKVDGRPEGRGRTGGGGAVTLGDLPRQRGEAPGDTEDAPPQGDPGQRPMRKPR